MASEYGNERARVERVRDLATLTIVLAGAVAIPLVFLRDASDAFRLPKLLVLRGEAILLLGVTLIALVLGAPWPRVKWRDPFVVLPLIALAVFAILTMTSTKPALSLSALGTAAATLVVFFFTVSVASRRGWILVLVPLAAATLNAILVVLEETNLWMPFGIRSDIPHHQQCSALIGNPNEVGSYLGAATLACIVMLFARGSPAEAGATSRKTLGTMAAVLVAGLIASQTLTAMAAFAAGAVAMVALSSWRKAIRVAIAGAVIAAIVMVLVAPMRQRAAYLARCIRYGEYNSLFSDRLTPFAAAWSMFTDHPLTGVGPNAFAWHYYDYKLGAEVRHPLLREAWGRGINYGEVHNDHLQALAEGGITGYGAFTLLLVALGSISFTIRIAATADRRRFALFMALPLAVFWIVLSIAQFPLETTVVRSLLVHFAALCVGWRNV